MLKDMPFGVGVGDAFGKGFEFFCDKRVDYIGVSTKNYVDRTGRFSREEMGHYTDDTQMTIAVIELLLSNKIFNKVNLAQSFIDVYKRDFVKGYAEGFQKFLESVNSGEEFVELIRPDSVKNGAAMRSVPLGVFPSVDDVVKYSLINASLTHDTPIGRASSVAVALMSHYSIHKQRLPYIYELSPVKIIHDETYDYLRKIANTKEHDVNLLLKEHVERGVPCHGMYTVGSVYSLLKHFKSAESVLREAVKLGGDTDSVASIALGVFSINNGLKLPSNLINDFRSDVYGKDYLLKLGKSLEDKFLL